MIFWKKKCRLLITNNAAIGGQIKENIQVDSSVRMQCLFTIVIMASHAERKCCYQWHIGDMHTQQDPPPIAVLVDQMKIYRNRDHVRCLMHVLSVCQCVVC